MRTDDRTNYLALIGHHGIDDDLYDCPPPIALVSLLSERDDGHDEEVLIESAYTTYNLPKDQTNDLVEKSYKDAEELARLMG